MEKKYFGTDGIRGLAFDKLNNKLAFRVGQALAIKYKVKEIVIGQDTRLSSSMLSYGIAYGASVAGVNVLIASVVSTPMVAYYSKVNNIIGVMVTASHNPYTDNGIKIFKSGYKMLDEEELDLESYIDSDEIYSSTTPGKIILNNEVEALYIKIYEELKLVKSNIKISYDTANGATYQIAKKVIENITDHSNQIGNNPDGLNINLNVGSTYMTSIVENVKENKSDIGLSFDGDGDRLLITDNNGTIYDGDMIVYIISKYLKEENKLNKNTVVLTKMSNPGMLKAFKNLGIKTVLTDVGDKYVSNEIVSNDYTIGGENSGHIIINDLLPSGDGLFAAMYVIKILTDKNISLYDYTKEVEMYPQKMINIKSVNKEILKNDSIINLLEDVKAIIGDDSLLLVRASGTEPLIRVTLSCKNENLLNQQIKRIVDLIKDKGSI